MRTRGNIVVLGLPSVISLLFLYSFAVTYLTTEPTQFGIYRERQDWLYVHVLAGGLALLLGPVQLWLGLNRRTAIQHRILGGFYVAAVLATCGAAFYLAAHTDFGWVFGLGLSSMAATAVIATVLAVIAVCLRRVEQHREWMIRSYVVMFGFVTFRVLESALEIAKAGTITERMTAAAWLAWTVPLLITESILQGRKIFGKAAPSAAAQAAPFHTSQAQLPFDPRSVLAVNASRIAEDTRSDFSLGKK